MLLIYLFLLLIMSGSCDQDGVWSKCKPKQGCTIGRCDPVPPRSFGTGEFSLKDNEFPILCQHQETLSSAVMVDLYSKMSKLEDRIQANEIENERKITKLERKNTELEKKMRKEIAELERENLELKKETNENMRSLRNEINRRRDDIETQGMEKTTNSSKRPVGGNVPNIQEPVTKSEGIMIFDKRSQHLQLFNPADNTLKQMQSFNLDMKRTFYTAVTLHDYIYVFMKTKSVHRLKYSDEKTTWERMPDMILDNGWYPPATVFSGCIYVAGGNAFTKPVVKFDPSSNKWSSLEKKKLANWSNVLVEMQDFIYSIGGRTRNRSSLREVERFDPTSSTWTFVAPMKQARSLPAAVEFNGKIFVLGGFFGGISLSSVEIYDPSTNTWSVMTNNMLKPRSHFSAFVINGDMYAVGGDQEDKSIERYSFERDVWEEVQIQTKREIRIYVSTKIKI